MNVIEARRTRTILLRLDKGEEIPSALLRALDEVEARSAFFTGLGEVESAEIAIYDQERRSYHAPMRLDGPAELVSLTGNAASLEGATSIRLSATLARHTDVGLSVVGGQLLSARAFAVEILVTVIDDPQLTRAPDERTGLALLGARAGAVIDVPRAAPVPREAPQQASSAFASPPPPAAPTHVATAPTPSAGDGPPLPVKPMRPKDDIEVYPDIGDSVTHFAFGECTVIDSIGDRIRLRQDKDGRVREVALSMLRIDSPTTLEDGRRFFKLARKN